MEEEAGTGQCGRSMGHSSRIWFSPAMAISVCFSM